MVQTSVLTASLTVPHSSSVSTPSPSCASPMDPSQPSPSPSPPSLPHAPASEVDTALTSPALECRICREASPPLLHPCHCTTPIHRTCLATWLHARPLFFPLRAQPPTCEICLAHYDLPAPLLQPKGRFSFLPHWLFFRISVECCLLLSIFVLTATGHAIYLLWMYGGNPKLEMFVVERFVLGLLNAVLTAAFLLLFAKLVIRWITAVEAEEVDADACRIAPVVVGAILSLVAGFEVYLIFSLASL